MENTIEFKKEMKWSEVSDDFKNTLVNGAINITGIDIDPILLPYYLFKMGFNAFNRNEDFILSFSNFTMNSTSLENILLLNNSAFDINCETKKKSIFNDFDYTDINKLMPLFAKYIYNETNFKFNTNLIDKVVNLICSRLYEYMIKNGIEKLTLIDNKLDEDNNEKVLTNFIIPTITISS